VTVCVVTDQVTDMSDYQVMIVAWTTQRYCQTVSLQSSAERLQFIFSSSSLIHPHGYSTHSRDVVHEECISSVHRNAAAFLRVARH